MKCTIFKIRRTLAGERSAVGVKGSKATRPRDAAEVNLPRPTSTASLSRGVTITSDGLAADAGLLLDRA
jgi:hypothetical protein